MAYPISIKSSYEGVYRKYLAYTVFEHFLAYKDLLRLVRERHQIPPNAQVNIFYTDVDGDDIRISTAGELSTLIREVRMSSAPLLRLKIVKVTESIGTNDPGSSLVSHREQGAEEEAEKRTVEGVLFSNGTFTSDDNAAAGVKDQGRACCDSDTSNGATRIDAMIPTIADGKLRVTFACFASGHSKPPCACTIRD